MHNLVSLLLASICYFLNTTIDSVGTIASLHGNAICAIPMQQQVKRPIQVYLEEDQIKWLDDNKGPELKRSGLIRTLIREKIEQAA